MTEDVYYREYCLTIMQNPPRWDVGIYPTLPKQRKPHPAQEVASAATRDEALAEAKRRVDRLAG
jgi:hypothetical protein